VSDGFFVSNGDGFTTWYTNLDDPPIHWGSRFDPPRHLFPTPVSGEVVSRMIYVTNVDGGRSSDPVSLTLTTRPAPPAHTMGLTCISDPDCRVCDGQNISLGIEMSQTYGIEQ